MIPPDDPRLIPRQHRTLLHLGDRPGKRRYKNGRFDRRHLFAFLLIMLFVTLMLSLYYSLKD